MFAEEDQCEEIRIDGQDIATEVEPIVLLSELVQVKQLNFVQVLCRHFTVE